METKTKTIAEYKAPRCKVVGIHVQNLVCTSFGEEGEAGANGIYHNPDEEDF